MKNKRIVIAGGSGFIGSSLAGYFGKDNNIVILGRGNEHEKNNQNIKVAQADEVAGNVRFVKWDGVHSGDWEHAIDGCDIVINLAGKSVNCRYTEKNKKQIFDSRTNTTEAIGNAIGGAVVPPKLWLNASSATIYRHATDRPQDEYTGEIQNDFSVQVCKKWEAAFFSQRTPFTRKIAMRMAVTLGCGSVMVPYLRLCKFGLGGRQGSGEQMFSWVHAEDICRAVEFFMEHSELEGVYNVCSPNPVTNSNFMNALRHAAGHKFGLPAPRLMLKCGAALIGTETELLLKSRWVVPTKLQQAGFNFKYEHIEDAFNDIISKLPRSAYHLF